MRVDFPYRVTKPEDLPESFADLAPSEGEVVFVPPWGFDEPLGGWWRGRYRLRKPAQAIAVGEDSLCVLRVEEEGGVLRRQVAFDDLLEVEIGHVLLHAWVAFAPEEGDPLRLDFNAVSLPMFEDIVDRVLVELTDGSRAVESESPADLGHLDLKFRNAVRNRLLPGEMLRAVAFAPALWERRFLINWRRLVAATALAATDRRLLIVEEGAPLGESTYGSTARSIPRERIAGMERTPQGVVVSCLAGDGLRGRLLPLSNPEVADTVIEAMRGEE